MQYTHKFTAAWPVGNSTRYLQHACWQLSPCPVTDQSNVVCHLLATCRTFSYQPQCFEVKVVWKRNHPLYGLEVNLHVFHAL